MRWSLRVGRIAGIDVYLHFTFLMLLAFVALAGWMAEGELSRAFGGLISLLVLFGIVVLHELGHALAARRYGIRTRDITLLPIGGVARLERMPSDPRQELVVALAGPAVNVVLAGLGFVMLAFATSAAVLYQTPFYAVGPLGQFIIVNVVLAAFNLLPAFPMDGGRVLRALLALKLDYVHATNIAAQIGQGMAVFFGLLGLFYNPFLIFIAFFIWIGASGEASTVQMRSALGGIPVSRAMITEYHTLSPDDPLSRAVAHVLSGFQQDFPVIQDGDLVGILTRKQLVKDLAEQGENALVRDSMSSEFSTAEPGEMLDHVFERLSEAQNQFVPVLVNGRLIGIVTPENVGEFVMFRSALRRPSEPVAAAPYRPPTA